MNEIPLLPPANALNDKVSDNHTSGWTDRIVKSNSHFPTNSGCMPTSFQGCNAGKVAGAPMVSNYTDVNWTRVKGARAYLLIKPSEDLAIELGAFWRELQQGAPKSAKRGVRLAPTGGGLAHFEPAYVAEPSTLSDCIARGKRVKRLERGQ